MKKLLAIIVMSLVMVVSAIPTQVFATEMTEEELWEKKIEEYNQIYDEWEESLSKEYKEAINKYGEDLSNCQDFNEMYNVEREFYLTWGKEKYNTMIELEEKTSSVFGYEVTEEAKQRIKEMCTWYDTAEEIKKHPYSPANGWRRIRVCGTVSNKEEGEIVGVAIELQIDAPCYLRTYSFTQIDDDEFEIIMNVPVNNRGANAVEDATLIKGLNIWCETIREDENGECIIWGATQTLYKGEKTTISRETPLYLAFTDLEDVNKISTLEFAVNGELTEEQIAENAKTMTFDESTELAKEEGFIKEVAPVEKKEDEVIKAVTGEDANPVDTRDTAEETSGKTFPVLPMVIGVAVCLIGAVVFVVIKRKDIKRL